MTSSTSSITAQATSAINTNNTNLVYKSSIQEELAGVGMNLNAIMKDALAPLILGVDIFRAFATAFYTPSCLSVFNFCQMKFGFVPMQFVQNAGLLTGVICTVLSAIHVNHIYVNEKIKKIADQSLGNSKSALLIRADLSTDDNGVYSTEQGLIPIKMLAKNHSIKYVNGYSDTLNSIQSDIKNSQKYDVILVQGHGNQHEIPLDSNGHGLTRLYLPSEAPDGRLPAELSWELAQVLKENGKIILHACSTGEGEYNFALSLSNIAPLGAAVYAASGPITGSQIDKNGNARLSSMLTDITRIYQNGELIYSSLPTQVRHEEI